MKHIGENVEWDISYMYNCIHVHREGWSPVLLSLKSFVLGRIGRIGNTLFGFRFTQRLTSGGIHRAWNIFYIYTGLVFLRKNLD